MNIQQCFEQYKDFTEDEIDLIEQAAEAVALDNGRTDVITKDYIDAIESILEELESELAQLKRKAAELSTTPTTDKKSSSSKKSHKIPPENINQGQVLWDKLVEADPDLKPYEKLDAIQRAILDDIVAKYGPDVKVKDSVGLQTLIAEARKSPGIKFGRAALTRDTYTADELLNELRDFIRADIPGHKLFVVDSVEDLLLHPDQKVKLVGAALFLKKGAYGVAADGRAFLIASRIKKGTGRAKFMHEVGAHLGLENLLPKNTYDRLTDQLVKWVNANDGSIEHKLALAAAKRVSYAKTPKIYERDELLAYFLEEAVKAGIDPIAHTKTSGPLRTWLQTLWRALKSALTKLGFKPEKLTAQDIVNLAFGAARIEITGAVPDDVVKTMNLKFGVEIPRAANRAVVEQTINRLPPELRNKVRAIWQSLKEYASRGLDKVVFTADLLDRAVEAGIKSARTYQILMTERGAKTREYELQIENIADMYQAIPTLEEAKRANDLARESTRRGVWAYQPTWLDENVDVDPDLNAEWKTLSPQAQAWIDAMFKFERDMLERKRRMVVENATAIYKKTVKAAYDAINNGELDEAGVKAAERDIMEAQRNMINNLRRFEQLFAMYINKPYLPLKRFGQYAVVAKSAEYKEAEENGDTNTLKKLQSDENHYYVDFAESLFEANMLRDKLEREFGIGNVESFEREQFHNIYGSEGLLATMSKLRAIIDSYPAEDKIDHTALRRMQSILSEMYLKALADNSARKSEIRRKGVAGDIDMLRSFTTQGKADAQFLSAVEYNDRIQEAIQNMRMEAANSGPSRRMRASALFNEINKRYMQSLSFDLMPITQKITRLTSIWFLATSPAYYLQNLTQPFMMSVPLMAGRHGWSRAATALYNAYTELGQVIRSGTALTGFDFSMVPDDVREAVNYLVKRGLIDIGLDTELGEFRAAGTSRAKAIWNTVDKFLRISAQKIESINRLSTAIAAYRLELAKTGNKQAAMEYAAKIINDTHGDYTAFNAPRAFNTNLGRIILQFRKFQLIQLTLLAKLLRNAGFNTEEKRTATAALGFILGHTAILAGVMGLPGYAAIAWAVNALFGTDDDPFDLTQWLRSAIGDKDIANLIMRGTPTLVGADLSGKIGMGNALSILPFTDVDLLDRRSSAEALGTLIGGAPFGLFQRMADGLALISNGNYYKGLEMLMPKGISDVMKAVRYTTDGVTRRNNDILIPESEISSLEAAMQAIGVPVVQFNVRSERQEYVLDTIKRLSNAASKIKNDYTAAVRKRDYEAMRDASRRWVELQNVRRNLGLNPQPLSVLFRAPREQAKRERNTIDGVQREFGVH